MFKHLLYIGFISFFIMGCSDDDQIVAIEPVSQVSVDLLQVPYQTLSEYGFFEEALSELTPTFGVLPYEPISSLFSNYAKKSRFIWLPSGTIGT